MKLSELLKAIPPVTVSSQADPEIAGLYYDSRQVRPGGLFFALRGVSSDGHRFIPAALAAGAAAVVVEEPVTVPAGVPAVLVADSRQAMTLLAAAFYGEPTAHLPLVGITGTNGKTTTSYLVEGVLEAAGLPAAVLGTISYRFRDEAMEASHTTPESVDLQHFLRQLVDRGARSVVMEVSSHALEQHRVDGCRFRVGVFTNLTRDHLDYHQTMDAYLASKLRLFGELLPRTPGSRAVVNLDDAYGPAVIAAAGCPTVTYGLTPDAMVTARDVSCTVNGISATVATPLGEFLLVSQLMGRFNLSNLLAAVAVGVALELPLTAIQAGLTHHRPVPGRLERVANERGLAILVDYAHTGDALENVLRTLVEIRSGRLITLFGCGGDRDRGKRPVMGELAVRYSDLAVVTSDNPRTEDPAAIIAEIRAGIEPTGCHEFVPDELTPAFAGKGFVTITDRREAIRLAVRVARPGDIVLLAGKGHEDYQIIGTVKHHFDDREEAAEACRVLG